MSAEALTGTLALASGVCAAAVVAEAERRSSLGGLWMSTPPRAGWRPRAWVPRVTDVLRGPGRRRTGAETQLADAVGAIADGVRSGSSLVQAIAAAGVQIDVPLGPALRDVADRVALGAPLDETLDRWAAGSGLPDVRLVAGVLRLHRRTGGALPRVLDALARTLRDRRAAAAEIRSLTAQARLSGAILGVLPIGFFLFLFLTSRRDVLGALGSPAGRTAIALGLVLQATAFLWIRRLLRVEA